MGWIIGVCRVIGSYKHYSASLLALVPFSNRCGITTKGPASLLAHCLVSTPFKESVWDHNEGPSVLTGILSRVYPFRKLMWDHYEGPSLLTSTLPRVYPFRELMWDHYKGPSVLTSTLPRVYPLQGIDVGPPRRAQRPYWYTASRLPSLGNRCGTTTKGPASLLAHYLASTIFKESMWDYHKGPSVLIGTLPRVYPLQGIDVRPPRRALRPYWHIASRLPSSGNRCETTTKGPASLLGHCLMSTPFRESMWDHHEGPSVLTGTLPRVYPFQGIDVRPPRRAQRPYWDIASCLPPSGNWCWTTTKGPTSLLAHCLVSTPFKESMWDHHEGPSVLTGTSPRVYPFMEQPPR